MPFSNTSIEIRPRTQWESIDLGILLARKHCLLIIGTWLLATLPVFFLLTFIFWHQPFIPVLIIWWLKPIFDRIPLHILSHVTFNNVPTAKQTLAAWFKGLKHYLFTDLIFSRISLTRSFNLPVQQLENASGKTRRLRLRVLSHSQNKAGWLTIIFINFELILSGTASFLLFKLLPENLFTFTDETFLEIFTTDSSLWLSHLSSLLYISVLAITEPLYIACGFCLYLNRRITLEGWDIELAFRRLSKRLSQLVSVVAIALLIPYMLNSNLAIAQTDTSQETEEQLDITPLTGSSAKNAPSGIIEKRAQAKQSIKKIVNAPPFYELKEETTYRWKSSETPDDTTNKNSHNNLNQTSGWFFSNLFPLLLWSLVAVFVVMILWYAVNQLPSVRNRRKEKNQTPDQIFGLAIKPETLPDNILVAFEQQWQGQPRQALSLLYRALLSHLVHQHRLPLKNSHTEYEVVALARTLKLDALSAFTQHLTEQWLLVAYGHYLPDTEQKDKLKQGWQQIQSIQELSK